MSIREIARKASSDLLIQFAEEHGFLRGSTKGDDIVYYHPINKRNGAECNMKITLNQKSTPEGTMGNIIRWSGVSRTDWADWFSKI